MKFCQELHAACPGPPSCRLLASSPVQDISLPNEPPLHNFLSNHRGPRRETALAQWLLGLKTANCTEILPSVKCSCQDPVMVSMSTGGPRPGSFLPQIGAAIARRVTVTTPSASLPGARLGKFSASTSTHGELLAGTVRPSRLS